MTAQTAALILLGLFLAASLIYAFLSWAGDVVAAHVADALGDLDTDTPIWAATVRDMPEAGELAAQFAQDVESWLERGESA